MIGSHEIIARVLAGFAAEPHERPSTRTSPDGAHRVGMLLIPDCPDTGLSSWATLGASAFPTPFRTPDERSVRVEFVAAADARLDRFGDAVAACAFAIDPAHDVKPGTVYRDAVSRVYPSAATPHLFSVAPFIWEADIAPYDDDEAHVTWLQLVPITDDEAQFVTERGADALEDAFLRQQPDLFTIDRADVRGVAIARDPRIDAALDTAPHDVDEAQIVGATPRTVEDGTDKGPAEDSAHAALLDTVSLLAEIPWAEPEEEDEPEQEWQLGEFSGSTAWGIMRLVPLTGWSPSRPEDERDPLIEAMDRRWGTQRLLDLGALPDYDSDAETLDMRSLLKMLVQHAGGNQALCWQATRRRIVVAVFDRRKKGLLRRRPEKQIVGIIVAPTEILDPPAPDAPEEAEMSDDPVAPLLHAIVRGIDESMATRDDEARLPEDCESFSLVIELTDDGRYVQNYGYAYGPDDTRVQTITTKPTTIEDELADFLADRYPDGQATPVKVLFQLRLTDGRYDVLFEDGDRLRWKVSATNYRQIQQELRPVFDD